MDPDLGRGSELLDGKRRLRGISLFEGDATHALVLGSPREWLEPVVDAQVARARHLDSLVGAARILLAADAIDDAEARLREALAIAPDHVEALFQSGWVAVKRGRWQEAHALFHRVVELDPRHLDAQSNVAWSLGRLGRWFEALAALDALVLERPEWKLVSTNRAWVLRALGREDEAVAEDERAGRL